MRDPARIEAELANLKLEALLERARSSPPPTPHRREEQALSFAWGNLTMTTHHKPTLDGFRKLAAERYGWSTEEFDAFAKRMGWAK